MTIDNVEITAQGTGCPGLPYAWFQLDESGGSLNGTAGELVDQQSNANLAFALGTGNGVNHPYPHEYVTASMSLPTVAMRRNTASIAGSMWTMISDHVVR